MPLKSRRLRVSEVSALVGYRNFAAFSHAFRERFGMRPSDVLSARASRHHRRVGSPGNAKREPGDGS